MRIRLTGYGRILWGGLALLLILFPVLACAGGYSPAGLKLAPGRGAGGYFDPHNHLTNAILPYWAYADVKAFHAHSGAPGSYDASASHVTTKNLFGLYMALYAWYEEQGKSLGSAPFADHGRFALGARGVLATLPPKKLEAIMKAGGPYAKLVRGSLQRILTATPYTEFDSAYAFRGDPVRAYYAGAYAQTKPPEILDSVAYEQFLCRDMVEQLAAEDIVESDQSLSFIGGFYKKDAFLADRAAKIRCAATEPRRLHANTRIHILLMTHTSGLGAEAGGVGASLYDPAHPTHTPGYNEGRCEGSQRLLRTPPPVVQAALLGEDGRGNIIFDHNGLFDREAYFDTVTGIDTAGPELTCFTSEGMKNYRDLVTAVYHASVARRRLGWSGKLLVRTHVGEGMSVYYARNPPRQSDWTFATLFGVMPALDGNIVRSATAARRNIDMLLDAIAAFESAHEGDADRWDRYIVFRLGHVTAATPAQAERMASLHVEADVNLDSNIATGAYTLSDMQFCGRDLAVQDVVDPRLSGLAGGTAEHRWAAIARNFQLNDLPYALIPDPGNESAVGCALGKHALKYLLRAGVRVMLGTDGGGVEHSGIRREYRLADTLLKYWRQSDADFRHRAYEPVSALLYKNVQWHLDVMDSDTPYAASYQIPAQGAGRHKSAR